jgi:hypothetical protein
MVTRVIILFEQRGKQVFVQTILMMINISILNTKFSERFPMRFLPHYKHDMQAMTIPKLTLRAHLPPISSVCDLLCHFIT